MRNPKVARLSDKKFRLWVELLAVASENEGSIPCLDDLRYVLNRRLDHLSTGVDQLISMGLIDLLADGYEPHNWSKFQYKSDTSNERVAKHRAKRNVTVTAPDTETEQSYLSSKEDKPQAANSDKDFWDNSKAYLKPHNSNPGALIGKWCKGGKQAIVAKAITAAQLERAVDPVAFIERCMKNADKLDMPTC